MNNKKELNSINDGINKYADSTLEQKIKIDSLKINIAKWLTVVGMGIGISVIGLNGKKVENNTTLDNNEIQYSDASSDELSKIVFKKISENETNEIDTVDELREYLKKTERINEKSNVFRLYRAVYNDVVKDGKLNQDDTLSKIIKSSNESGASYTNRIVKTASKKGYLKYNKELYEEMYNKNYGNEEGKSK